MGAGVANNWLASTLHITNAAVSMHVVVTHSQPSSGWLNFVAAWILSSREVGSIVLLSAALVQ